MPICVDTPSYPTPEKLQERYEKLEELARNHTADQLEVPEKRRQLWINRIKNRDLEIVRGIYLTNPELIEKKEGDALVRRVIRQYPDTVGLSTSTKLNLIVLKLKMGEIQTRTALKEAREYTKRWSNHLHDKKFWE